MGATGSPHITCGSWPEHLRGKARLNADYGIRGSGDARTAARFASKTSAWVKSHHAFVLRF